MTRRTAAADGDDDDESTTKPRKPAVVRSSKRARRAPKAVYDNDFEAHEIQNVRRLFVSSSSLFLSLETFTTTRVPLEIRNNNKTTDDDTKQLSFCLGAFFPSFLGFLLRVQMLMMMRFLDGSIWCYNNNNNNNNRQSKRLKSWRTLERTGAKSHSRRVFTRPRRNSKTRLHTSARFNPKQNSTGFVK